MKVVFNTWGHLMGLAFSSRWYIIETIDLSCYRVNTHLNSCIFLVIDLVVKKS